MIKPTPVWEIIHKLMRSFVFHSVLSTQKPWLICALKATSPSKWFPPSVRDVSMATGDTCTCYSGIVKRSLCMQISLDMCFYVCVCAFHGQHVCWIYFGALTIFQDECLFFLLTRLYGAFCYWVIQIGVYVIKFNYIMLITRLVELIGFAPVECWVSVT